MIKISELKAYFESLVPENLAILTVVQEEHLKKKLNGKPGPSLAIVYPSFAVTGTPDNVVDDNICLLYILEHSSKPNMTDVDEIEMYERLQGYTNNIKEELISAADNNHPFFIYLDRQSIEIEPEWNVAGSYNGYSIVFSFKK